MAYKNPFDDPDLSADLFASVAPQPKPKKESTGEAVARTGKDLWASFGEGAGGLVKGVGTFFGGSDSTLAELGSNAQEHWRATKSEKLRTQEAELSRQMQDDNVSAWGVAKHVITNPYLASNMVAGSTPAMAAGMGAGGLVARSMAGAGIMSTAGGGLTSMGARTAAGIGEGLTLVPDVYEATQGNKEAGVAALALGVVTNLVTPGNLGSSVASKVTKSGVDLVEDRVNKYAVGRVAKTMVAEGSQEYLQEGGQALLEQAGRGEDINLGAATKQGAVGAVLGAITGGALHGVTVEGAPVRTIDGTLTEVGVSQLNTQLADINTALTASPNNPVLLALAAVVEAELHAGTTPAAQRQAADLQVTAAKAQLQAALDPTSRTADDAADHATAEAALAIVGPEGLVGAADAARSAVVDTLNQAPDLDSALQVFSAGEQASATLRVVAPAINTTLSAVDLANTPEVSQTFDEASAEVITPEQELKLEQQRLRTEHQALKNQTAAVKLQQEIAKAKGEEITIEAPAEAIEQIAYPGTEGIAVEDAADQFATREAVFAAYEPQIRALETAVMDIDRTVEERNQALTQMNTIQAERDRMAEGLPNAAPVATQQGEGDSTPSEIAAGDMLNDGYSQAVIEQQRTLPDDALRASVNASGQEASRRRHAFEILQERGSNAGLTRAQFETRETAFENAIARTLPMTAHGNRNELISSLAGMSTDSLRRIGNSSGPTAEIARATLAFRTGQHMGNWDQTPAGSQPTAVEAAPEGPYQLQISPDRQIVDVVDANGYAYDTYRGNSAVQDATATRDRLNSRPAGAPTPTNRAQALGEAPARTRAQALADELRAAANEADDEPEAIRSVTSDFRARSRAALANGVLEKLGNFWKSVMSGRGQRVLNVNTTDLANRATRTSDIAQRDLDTLRDRYNRELNRQARAWAAANNQVVGQLRDPVVSLTQRGAAITIRVRGLGRNGSNPYMAVPSNNTGHATVDGRDGHMTTVSLDEAPGSSDLAYRLGAEIGRMAGMSIPASGTLLTNNPMRRQMQSVFADSIFGPGQISPITSGGNMSPQGVPSQVWADAGQVERIGLNVMRAAHSVTESRIQSPSAAVFLENLRFNSDGQIYAATDPRHTRGWPQGTVVTDAMLLTRLLDRAGPGGVSAAGRSEQGGVGIDTAKLAIMTNTVLSVIESTPHNRIPAWMVTKAKQIGRDMGGWMFSQTAEATGAPITRESATEHLTNLVGENIAHVLTEGGMVSFVDTAVELTGETFSDADGNVQGATLPDGSIVMVLENLNDKTFDAVLQHEALHSTLRTLVGEDTYDKLMSQLDTLLRAGKGANWATEAEARVPANTNPGARLEEVAAYAVELAAREQGSSNPLVRWAKSFMSALRSAIISNKALPEMLRTWAIKNLQPQDLQRLALAGLRGQAAGASGETSLSSARDYQGEIDSLMAEHAMPETTNERRAEINKELGQVRVAQNAQRDSDYAAGRRSEGASYGTPREGAVSVTGVHYSGAERATLSSTAYGNGAKGEEAARLNDPANSDIKARTHFYVDEGNGIRKEAGVGSVGHEVKLNNLYNTADDTEGFVKLNRGNPSAMERAVMNAGFDGYYAPNYRDMGQGVAVLIGNHTVPVDPYSAQPGAKVEQKTDSYAENLSKSKLPAGQMLAREWQVAIKGTEFDTPAVQQALAEREGSTVYRDDLPRFNRGIRYSITEEVKATTEPVADASPQELNILNNGARGPFERSLEKLRSVWQDKHVTLRRIQQIAGVMAEQIRLDTLGALDRLGSRLMTQQSELVKKPLAKIEHILTSAGFSAEEGRKAIDDLLIAMHVKEYNAHIATINPARYEMRDGVRTHVSGFDADHPGSGITDKEAADTIDRLTSGEGAKAKALLEARDVYRKMIADLQAYAVTQGLEKQETIDTWNEKFPNYAPFNRDLDLDENLSIGTVPGSQGFSLRTGIARRAMGSSADIVSPLASTMLFGLKTTTRGENAEVARTFLNFARSFVPNYMAANGELRPMWKVEVTPNQRVVKKVNVYQTRMADGSMSPEFYNRAQARDYADYQQSIWEQMNPGADPQNSGIEVQQVGNGPQNRVVVQPVPNPMARDDVMVIPEDGENVTITFDKDSKDAMAIIEAFKGKANSGSNANTINKLLALPRMFSRWVMATATGFNPVFSLFNAARDVQGSMLSIGSDQIPGWTTADSLAIGKNFFAAAGSIWAQNGREFRALHSNNGAPTPPAPGSYAAWADEMIKYGGATGVRESVADIDDAETQIRRLFGQSEMTRTTHVNEASDWLSRGNGFVAKIGDSFARFGEGETKAMGVGWVSRNIVSATARLNEASELATRTAVFKAATEKFMAAGKTEQEAKTLAANISKNVSTNFNRRGTASSTINQLFPFFNAAMQGSARLAESLFEKNTYTVTANGHVMTDQKTKMTAYGKVIVSSLVGLGGLQAALLALAGFEDDEPPKHIKDRAFIVPFGGGSYIAIPMPHGFNTIINFGREMADAAIHPDKATGHIGNALWQAPAFNPFGSAGNLITDFSPAILDPVASLYMNKDAFGRPIAKENPDPANPTPGFTRAKEGASKTGRAIAKALNTITGGNEDQLGAVSPTPDQIDFAIGAIGGGVGREVMKAGTVVSTGVDKLAGKETEPVPTYKLPLIGRIYGDINEPVALRSKVFTVRQELNDLHARYKGLKSRGETDEANAFWDAHPELALRDSFERFVKQDSKQRKSRALARDAEEISDVNRITNAQDEKIAELIARYKEIKLQ